MKILLILTIIMTSWAQAESCKQALKNYLKIPKKILSLVKPQPIAGETRIRRATAYAESIPQNLIAIGYEDGTIRLFDRDTGRQRAGNSGFNGGYLKQDTVRVSFLGFLENGQVLVARHPGPSQEMSVGYYFDIRTFFKKCLVQYRIIVGKVWGASPSELMSRLVVNYDQEESWPASPVPLKCGEPSKLRHE